MALSRRAMKLAGRVLAAVLLTTAVGWFFLVHYIKTSRGEYGGRIYYRRPGKYKSPVIPPGKIVDGQ